MEIEELIERIRKKDSPERAEELISLINENGPSYAKYLMSFYDDIHMKYDSVLYGESNRGVLFVEKNGMYGVTDKNGNEIVPCESPNYYDAYNEWKEMGFPNKPVVMTKEDLTIMQFKAGLKNKYNELISSGDIKKVTFFNERTIVDSEFVILSDGSIGIAAALVVNESEAGKDVEILNSDGKHVMFLTEPELLKSGIPVICTDENHLYVATYNTKYSYIACYRMGDFKRVWKTPMYGSRIQSITVNDNEVIIFDMEAGKIEYFDKKNGKRNENKEISNLNRHHDLAATNEKLLTGSPGFSFGLLEFENELKVFDNASGKSIAQKSVSQFIGTLNSLTVDQRNNRIFLAFDNKIAVFGEGGFLGYFLAPTGNIQKLNFDQETGYLMISMSINYKGQVEVYSPEAVATLLQTHKELKTQLETKVIGMPSKITGGLQAFQNQFNKDLEINQHVR